RGIEVQPVFAGDMRPTGSPQPNPSEDAAMTWDRGRYYVRKGREGDQVQSEYLGTGPLAEQAADQDAEERLQRQAVTAAYQAIRERARAVDEAMEKFSAALDCLFQATLLAAGYHQHDRGEWRKRDERKTKKAKKRRCQT